MTFTHHARMLSALEVEAQRQRFEAFLKSANLVKIGERWNYFLMNDAKDGRFNAYQYIFRVLSRLAKVNGAMYYPGADNLFYREILEFMAVKSWVDSMQPKV